MDTTNITGGARREMTIETLAAENAELRERIVDLEADNRTTQEMLSARLEGAPGLGADPFEGFSADLNGLRNSATTLIT